MYYLAYGSNLNLEDMKFRCPHAKVAGKTVLHDYRLVYRGSVNDSYLTIEPEQGYCVPLGIWEIEESDEASMDIYEGYPELYDKKMMETEMDGTSVKALIYIMNEGYEKAVPASSYVNTCMQGYRDFGFDENILKEAYAYSCREESDV